MQFELPRELDRIFDRELGARADGEMRGVHRVAHQHHIVVLCILEPPLLADHTLEVDPRRATQMARIGHQLCAVEVVCEDFFAERDGLILVRRIQAAGLPRLLRGLDDEGGRVVVELVDVRLKPAVLGTHEIEGEGLVHLVRAQPDETVGTRNDVGLEDIGVFGANA